jgi:sterol desaturase/sphingolipid hydroxylase (fatty acid hydroxylase superfamily)
MAAPSSVTSDNFARAPAPDWLAVALFVGCVFFFLACLRSLFDPEFRDRFLPFSAWHARVKAGTHISFVSAVTASLLAGSFATLIGFSVFHYSSEKIESYLGPFAAVMILVHLISLYIDERRSKSN